MTLFPNEVRFWVLRFCTSTYEFSGGGGMGYNSTHNIDNTRWCWCSFKTLIRSYYSPLILWPPDVKNWPTGKDPDAGKDWRQEAKGMTEDEIVGWYHRLNGHEFEQALGVSDGQGSLAWCSPRGHKELDMTEWLNWIDSPLKLFRDSSLLSR